MTGFLMGNLPAYDYQWFLRKGTARIRAEQSLLLLCKPQITSDKAGCSGTADHTLY